MKKLPKFILLFIVISFISLIAITSLAFSKTSNYDTTTSDIVSTIDKVKNADLQNEEVLLNNSDLNALLGMTISNNQDNIIPVDIKGIYSELNNDKITLSIPFSFKNADFILSSKGTVTLDKDKLVYVLDYIKLGNLNLPFTLLSKILKDKLTSQLLIDNKKIMIDKTLIPISVSSLVIEKDKLKIKIENNKTVSTNILKEIVSLPYEQKNNNIKADDTNLNNTQNNTLEKSLLIDNTIKTNSNEKVSALVQVKSELNSAVGLANSPSGKSIILNMQNTINKMISNPSYNYASDASQVKAAYSKLSSEEKNDMKRAIFSSVKPATISIIRNAFGI